MGKKDLKIIHLVPCIQFEQSGPSYSVKRLVQSLNHYHKDTFLYTINYLGNNEIKDKNKNIKTFKLSIGGKELGRSRELLKQLYEDARKYKKLIIHNHGMWSINALYGSWVRKRFNNCVLIQSPRGSLSKWGITNGSILKKPFWYIFQKNALRKVDFFHATSDKEVEEISSFNFSKKIINIPNGIDLPRNQEEKFIINEKLKLLFLSRIHPKKGLNLLIDVWADFFKKQDNCNWELIIVGDDKVAGKSSGYKRKLENIVEKRKMMNIFFKGSLNGDRKREIFQSADCFILPSFSENFGLVVGEAMSYRLPVIVSNQTHWLEIEKLNAGWVIEPTIVSLRSILKKLLDTDKITLQKMGNNGYNHIKNNYNWDKIGNEMYKSYVNLLN